MSPLPLFGRDRKAKENEAARAMIVKLRDTEEMVQKKINFLEHKIEQETALAKKHGKTNKRAALQALSRKKRFEKQIQQLDGMLCTLEFQREALESANLNKEVVGSMQTASKAMKSMNTGVTVDNINKLMDDIHEQKDISDELGAAISTPLGSKDFDEDDLMAELKQLEMEDEDEQVLSMPAAVKDRLPGVTDKESEAKRKEPKKGKKKDEDDMEKLQAWLA